MKKTLLTRSVNLFEYAKAVVLHYHANVKRARAIYDILEKEKVGKFPSIYITGRLAKIFEKVLTLVGRADLMDKSPIFSEDSNKMKLPKEINFQRKLKFVKQAIERTDIDSKFMQHTFRMLVNSKRLGGIEYTISFFEKIFLDCIQSVFAVLENTSGSPRVSKEDREFLLQFFNIFINYPTPKIFLETLLGIEIDAPINPPVKFGNLKFANLYSQYESKDPIYAFMMIDRALYFQDGKNNLSFDIISIAKRKSYFYDPKLLAFIDDIDKSFQKNLKSLSTPSIEKALRYFYLMVSYLRSQQIITKDSSLFSGYLIRLWLVKTTCFDGSRTSFGPQPNLRTQALPNLKIPVQIREKPILKSPITNEPIRNALIPTFAPKKDLSKPQPEAKPKTPVKLQTNGLPNPPDFSLQGKTISPIIPTPSKNVSVGLRRGKKSVIRILGEKDSTSPASKQNYLFKYQNAEAILSNFSFSESTCEIKDYLFKFDKYFFFFWKVALLMDGAGVTPSDALNIRNRNLFVISLNQSYNKLIPDLKNEFYEAQKSTEFFLLNDKVYEALKLENGEVPKKDIIMKVKRSMTSEIETTLKNIISSDKAVLDDKIKTYISNISNCNQYVGFVFLDIAFSFFIKNKSSSSSLRILELFNISFIDQIQQGILKTKTDGFFYYMMRTTVREDESTRMDYFSSKKANKARFFDFFFYVLPRLDQKDLEDFKVKLYKLEKFVPIECPNEETEGKEITQCSKPLVISNLNQSIFLFKRFNSLLFFNSFVSIFDMYDYGGLLSDSTNQLRHNTVILPLFNSIYRFFAFIREDIVLPLDTPYEWAWNSLTFCMINLNDFDQEHYLVKQQFLERLLKPTKDQERQLIEIKKFPRKIEEICKLSMREHSEIFYFIFFYILNRKPDTIEIYKTFINSRIEYRLDALFKYISLGKSSLQEQIDEFCFGNEEIQFCVGYRIFRNIFLFLGKETTNFNLFYWKHLHKEMEIIKKYPAKRNQYRAILWNVLFSLSKISRATKNELSNRLLEQGRIDYEIALKANVKQPFREFFDLLEFNEHSDKINDGDVDFFAKFLKGRYSSRPTILLDESFKKAVELAWNLDDPSIFYYENLVVLTEIIGFFLKYTSDIKHYKMVAKLLIQENRVLDCIGWSSSVTSPFEDLIINKFITEAKNDSGLELLKEGIKDYMKQVKEDVRRFERMQSNSSNLSQKILKFKTKLRKITRKTVNFSTLEQKEIIMKMFKKVSKFKTTSEPKSELFLVNNDDAPKLTKFEKLKSSTDNSLEVEGIKTQFLNQKKTQPKTWYIRRLNELTEKSLAEKRARLAKQRGQQKTVNGTKKTKNII